ncbi:monosaccharide ABC transporter membrane protein, CUT2 family (TC 3.A.1.2.-) [Natronincola peptidivorans]|uniref:Monosaccharide ABC transporter membrane protein, CUT2 family (TC 3.A.1.2.-) n=1 Tax=Natronincola peptidivorans TaxID=426128 RepID=A0A1I0D136_9FIRM|nr:ABC transporter permease [Natronincola peptidivorans]SET25296.1 monosaccharide ABC transporter membrane protein, CUT2 family (TC 3.A.1.2.-) [Natronincola peptidivorans]
MGDNTEGLKQSENSQQINRKSMIIDFITKWGTLITIGLLILVFSILMPPFISASNIVTILRSISIVTVIAIGITVSLTVNGFDLSVGSVSTFSVALVVSMFVWYDMSTIPAILIALLVSVVVVASLNAFLIVKVKIPDMLATLSMLFIIEGVAMTYTGGGSISQGMPRLDGTPTIGRLTPAFRMIGQAPYIIIIMLVVVISVHIFLNYTKHGRYMYVVGGNQEAARLSGIPVNRYRALAYYLATFLAALGGIMLAARIGSAQINAGAGYLMPAVAASFIGISVGGAGKPNALGTFVGAVLVGVLENGLVMLSVPYYSLNIVKGAVLALALASTYLRKK